MFNTDWLLRDKRNFMEFSHYLSEIKNERVYQTEIMKVLLNEFYGQYFDKIWWRCFLPWVVYGVFSCYFFATVLTDDFLENKNTEDIMYVYLVGLTVIICLISQI